LKVPEMQFRLGALVETDYFISQQASRGWPYLALRDGCLHFLLPAQHLLHGPVLQSTGRSAVLALLPEDVWQDDAPAARLLVYRKMGYPAWTCRLRPAQLDLPTEELPERDLRIRSWAYHPDRHRILAHLHVGAKIEYRLPGCL